MPIYAYLLEIKVLERVYTADYHYHFARRCCAMILYFLAQRARVYLT
jgi:hypothetical protein